MSSRLARLLSGGGVVALCLAAAACARPVSDFGRAEPSLLYDRVAPGAVPVGSAVAQNPPSAFNITDEEREMHDRVWRFLMAPHSDGWFRPISTRLRVTTGTDPEAGVDDAAYYRWLSTTRYQSSRVRFATLAHHAQLDVATLPLTFDAICRVKEMDRRRATASSAMGGLSAPDLEARRSENAAHVWRFAVALRYRYQSYALALDRLLVETPHEEARNANAVVTSLAPWVDRAERGEFCGEEVLRLSASADKGVPSRVLQGTAAEAVFLK